MRSLRYILIISILAMVFVIGVILFRGTSDDSQRTVCLQPFIVNGDFCCLDQNNNSVCDFADKGETIAPPELTVLPIEPQIESTGKVVRIADGQTIELEDGRSVRLEGIDAPAYGQHHYHATLQEMRTLLLGKTVKLERDTQPMDDHQTPLRYVYLDNENINLRLVRDGFARAATSPANVRYEEYFREAEKSARQRGIGVWIDPVELDRYACDDRCLYVAAFNYDALSDDCDNLNNEYVSLRNTCPYSCDLTGWTIRNSGIKEYTFPRFTLRGNEYFILFSGPGNDTDVYLHWNNRIGICKAVWNNDKDTLYLRNLDGELMLKYSYISR